MKRKRESTANKFAVAAAGVVVVLALCSTAVRFSNFNSSMSLKLIATNFSMPQGEINIDKNISKRDTAAVSENKSEQVIAPTEEATKQSAENTEKAEASDDSKTFPVIENQLGGSVAYNNFSVRNTTDYDIDYEYELSEELGFQMEDTQEPQVLIVHTHTTEGYLKEDVGYYSENYPFRSTNDSENVTQVGEQIVNTLKKNGIGAVQAKEHHDDPSYNGSYARSEETIYKYMEKYPSIKVIIDIHRDSIGYDDERGKIKPTFIANGKKAAQIMIMSGYDPFNDYGFPNWEYNLRFALRLQDKAETMYPGMTRPLYFGDFAYNMFINTGSLLIEVGTEVNTLEEAKYTGQLLGEVMSSVLKE